MPDPLPAATVAILQQGVENLKAHNVQANDELNALLRNLREQLATGYAVAPVATPLPTASEAIQRKRLELYSSQWCSEIIAAAALDAGFKEESSQRAKAILAENAAILDNTVNTPDPAGTESA